MKKNMATKCRMQIYITLIVVDRKSGWLVLCVEDSRTRRAAVRRPAWGNSLYLGLSQNRIPAIHGYQQFSDYHLLLFVISGQFCFFF